MAAAGQEAVKGERLKRIFCGTSMGRRYGVTRENMALAAKAGVERVEIAFFEGSFSYREAGAPERARRALDEGGVGCKSVHLNFGEDYDISVLDEDRRRQVVDDAKKGLTAAKTLKAEIAVVHGSDEPIADGERAARMKALRGSLRELCDAAKQSGVRLALELLPRTCLGHDSDEALEAVAGLPEDVIGFCVDVNHVNLREDPAAVVRRLGPRVLTFHISDNDGVDERHWFPFEGIIDWKGFMRAVRDIDYGGQFIFETSGSMGDDIEAYLRELRARFDRLMSL